MPVSSPKGKNEIKEWFSGRKDIKTIVDLGPGSGTYSKLLGRDKYHWKAIEIWEPYVGSFGLNDLYDEIIIGDIQDAELPDADCAIIGDVLEHIKKPGAKKTFKRIDAKYPHVVLSIPIDSHTQYVHEGNIYEKHLSVWTEKEIETLVPDAYKVREFVRRPPGRPHNEGTVLAIFIK